MKLYNKLVRDKIPGIIEESGKSFEIAHAVDLNEYKLALYRKMQEELDEFAENPSYEEAADIWEVFSSICSCHDLDISEVTRTAVLKAAKRGGFKDRIILISVEDDNYST